ncbi:hypothetical protein TNCV_3913511 [Trichonephila clavipes]|nr:hypothetical protein TNCV_3913511 [Trichonephila clavipes]
MIYPSGRVVSDTDCCVVGPGIESRRRHGCLQMHNAFAVRSTLNSHKPSREVGGRGEETWKVPDHPREFSLKMGEELRQIVLQPCIKAEFIASWACSQSSVVSSSKR